MSLIMQLFSKHLHQSKVASVTFVKHH